MSGDVTHPELSALTRSECLQLLATRSVGRLALVLDDGPLIVPVNFALDGEAIVIRTDPGTVLARADGTKVAFQIDETDAAHRSGWSVLVRGDAAAVHFEDADGLFERTLATEVSPWVPGERRLWIRIEPVEVSGRRVVPGDAGEWRLGTAAYM